MLHQPGAVAGFYRLQMIVLPQEPPETWEVTQLWLATGREIPIAPGRAWAEVAAEFNRGIVAHHFHHPSDMLARHLLIWKMAAILLQRGFVYYVVDAPFSQGPFLPFPLSRVRPAAEMEVILPTGFTAGEVSRVAAICLAAQEK